MILNHLKSSMETSRTSNFHDFQNLFDDVQECAANCSTPPTAQNTKENSSARTATPASTVLRDTASEVVLVACPWMPAPNSPKERKYLMCATRFEPSKKN